MLEREEKEVASLLRTSSVMAVVGGTHFSIKRGTVAQTCTRPTIVIFTPNPLKRRTTYHSDTSIRPILLLRTCGKVYVYVNHGIWYAQWVLRALSGDGKIVRVRLDPTERELRALFDNLDRHQQAF